MPIKASVSTFKNKTRLCLFLLSPRAHALLLTPVTCDAHRVKLHTGFILASCTILILFSFPKKSHSSFCRLIPASCSLAVFYWREQKQQQQSRLRNAEEHDKWASWRSNRRRGTTELNMRKYKAIAAGSSGSLSLSLSGRTSKKTRRSVRAAECVSLDQMRAVCSKVNASADAASYAVLDGRVASPA